MTMRTYRVTLANTGETFEVGEGDRILAAARRAGVWLPFECGWGSCGTCKVTVVEGEADLLFAEAPAMDARDARRRRMVTCQSRPLSDLVIKPTWVSDEPRPELPTADHKAQLVEVEELGLQICRFRFQLEGEAVYRAGQYAILELAPKLRRCYSMSDLPGSPVVELIAKRYEGRPGSEQLFRLPVGSSINMELPYGDMWLREGLRPVVLIAGGTGVSPILALVRQLVESGDQRPVRVFYGATTQDQLVCWDELASLVDRLPSGRLHGALLTGGDSWVGTTGLVTDALTPYLEAMADSDIYLAGPPPMVNAVRVLLREHSVQFDRIHYDSFG
ncbi:2Fe-2S iron-sulfur cluster binding domain-containing protein [Streptomyces sp. RB6PN25]|uniref:2Fe-2S iron-sulfur cluster binding domain-containing protein n=1 Tax=Streptomyces humicola TaxID=2953240 RepID=A0ABT1PPS3_9ACTN|nr:2Fe-2S iron-sulfur cluster binding domain-containing protein [Streptomyces humicola]MCQ4079118.1 2Fe-2S iron-sulfur cluster binding domain-containing protein [Streptomyces humicola]